MIKSYHPIGKPAVPSHVVKKKKNGNATRKSFSPIKSSATTRKSVVEYKPTPSQTAVYFETKYQNGGERVVKAEVRDEVAARVISKSP